MSVGVGVVLNWSKKAEVCVMCQDFSHASGAVLNGIMIEMEPNDILYHSHSVAYMNYFPQHRTFGRSNDSIGGNTANALSPAIPVSTAHLSPTL